MNRRKYKQTRDRLKRLLTEENRSSHPVDKNWAEFYQKWISEHCTTRGRPPKKR